MSWNWQKPDWRHFSYSPHLLKGLEDQFLHHSGVLEGTILHLNQEDQDTLKIELISTEAIKTSEIEGDFFNRESVQSSIKRHFGLTVPGPKPKPGEYGIAELMVDLYKNPLIPLSHDQLFRWHSMLMNGRRDVTIGTYRTHLEPMQIISGEIHKPKVHFEAPPSARVPMEMNHYNDWFNNTLSLPALTRAAIAHLYFESIHPFEDGNGRIGRALAEKSLAQSLGRPTLIALSYLIEKKKKLYYEALENTNRSNDIQDWIQYFAQTILEAQAYTQNMIEFLLKKTKLYDRLQGHLNERQQKALHKMFAKGLDGFEGGLSADKYISITHTSRATATRDLQSLVQLGALIVEGELKGTRYHLNI